MQQPDSILIELSVREVIDRVRGGELRAEELVSVLLERQRRLSSLNALSWIDEQRALQDAREVDRKRARGERLGTLAGLPLLIKDNIAVVGSPNAAGTPALRDQVATRNASVVQRLLDQGALVLARANMHELAGGGTSSNPTFGPVGNPYDPEACARWFEWRDGSRARCAPRARGAWQRYRRIGAHSVRTEWHGWVAPDDPPRSSAGRWRRATRTRSRYRRADGTLGCGCCAVAWCDQRNARTHGADSGVIANRHSSQTLLGGPGNGGGAGRRAGAGALARRGRRPGRR